MATATFPNYLNRGFVSGFPNNNAREVINVSCSAN